MGSSLRNVNCHDNKEAILNHVDIKIGGRGLQIGIHCIFLNFFYLSHNGPQKNGGDIIISQIWYTWFMDIPKVDVQLLLNVHEE